MKTAHYVCLALLILISNTLFSQHNKIKFRRLTINHGLSQGTITTILKDTKGFMWFGTLDGLNRYDGYNFLVYKNDYQDSKTINDSYINDILEDKKGNLWIGTQRGLDRLDRGKDIFIHYPLASNNLPVRKIIMDSKGNIWLATAEGLYLFDIETGKYKIYTQKADPSGLYYNSVYQIFEDRGGKLWILTARSLEVFDPLTQKFKYYRNDPKVPTSVIGNNFRTLYIDSKDNVWVGARGAGISLYDRKTDSFINFPIEPDNPTGLHDENITGFIEGNDGKIWVGTENTGVNIFDTKNKTFTAYKNDPQDLSSLSEDQVNTFYKDDIGNIWVGTWSGGINWVPKYGNKFIFYKNTPYDNNSLSSNIVKCVANDTEGNVWVGTKHGGISVLNLRKKSFTFYRHDSAKINSIVTDNVNAILQINKDTFALGYQNGGMDFFNRTTGKFTNHMPSETVGSIKGRTVNCFAMDSNKDIWIGMWGAGVNQYLPKEGKFIQYTYHPNDTNSLSNGAVHAILEDNLKQIWIGTENGLNRYNRNKKRFIRYLSDSRNPKSISNNIIYTIFQDSKQRLWIGTGGGLNLFNPKTNGFTVYTQKHGLPSNAIQGILEDKQGNLWISTYNGLAIFDPERGTNKKSYTIEDGLQSKEFSKGAAVKTPEGEMIFGGMNGLNMFYPDSIRDNPYLPPVVISDFQIFNKPVAIGEKGSPLQKNIMETDEVTLSYAQSVITFTFSALNFSAPAKNQYAYMLEGFEKEWNYVGNKRSTTYTNLDPGNYILRVKASNNDGLWNEKGTSLKIVITPPFWKTWWFQLLLFSVITGSAFSWYKSRLSSIKKQKEVLENQVNERTVEISIQKEELQSQAEKLQKANSEMTDSIRAALEIQTSLLPSENLIKKYLPESFVLYKPKDVVSGDFYWFDAIDNKIIIAVCDCTGHGVSGAFMSINSHHLLNQAIYPFKNLIGAEILDRLNKEMISETGVNKDVSGMDIAICIIDEDGRRLQFAGANNPLYIVRNNEVIQIKANRYSIGLSIEEKVNKFTNNEVELLKGDTFYIFSDGYADQIGGESGEEKYLYKRLREDLLGMQNEKMETQLAILENNLNKWKGECEQLDDILVIGFKV